jgi:hypothetical protein
MPNLSVKSLKCLRFVRQAVLWVCFRGGDRVVLMGCVCVLSYDCYSFVVSMKERRDEREEE